MIRLKENYPLKKLNTFRLEVNAKLFINISSEEELQELISLKKKEDRILVLGEGSNILFTDDFNGLVIHPAITGINITDKNARHVLIDVNAGENWDHFVELCVENNWGGLENLSDIPGSVGASPVQNIGAYGMEVKDRIVQVTAIDLYSGEKRIFSNEECEFAYRSSIFKMKLKHRYVITQVRFKLDLKHNPVLNYGQLELEVKKNGEPTLQNIRKAIIAIRKLKLPDLDKLGNAGSFFKNPVIDHEQFIQLQNNFGEFPYYIVGDMYKIPAAWLIEQCGFKQISHDHVSVYHKQPLVIVNTGGATGKEITDYANMIINTVNQRFSIRLEPEVNII